MNEDEDEMKSGHDGSCHVDVLLEGRREDRKEDDGGEKREERGRRREEGRGERRGEEEERGGGKRREEEEIEGNEVQEKGHNSNVLYHVTLCYLVLP